MLLMSWLRSLRFVSVFPTRKKKTTQNWSTCAWAAFFVFGASLFPSSSKLPTAIVSADEPPPVPAAKVNTPQRRGIEFLKKTQNEDGTWKTLRTSHAVGTNALCTLAMLRAGAKTTDAHIQLALNSLRKAKPTRTYDIALQTLVLCAVTPKDDLAQIQHNVDLLKEAQYTAGLNAGGWSYFVSTAVVDTAGDNSNSGFAIWALDEAQYAGAKVKPETWQRALAYWLRGQQKDGSWGYVTRDSKGTGSMTCTGIAALVACLNHKSADKVTKQEIDAVNRGVVWLKDNFAADRNPGSKSWKYYYLMKLRHMGDMTGISGIGTNYWYRDLSDHLKKQQDARDGKWNDRAHGPEESTALALLALQTNRPRMLALPGKRNWGVSGQVVDELNQPIVDSIVLGRWKLGGRGHTTFAKSNNQGRFTLTYPPTYFKVEWSSTGIDEYLAGPMKVISNEPLVLQAPRYRIGIQGIWEVTSWERAGRKSKPAKIRSRQVMISADSLSIWDGDKKVSQESYTINPAIEPQQIELHKNGKKSPGIFRLTSSRLTLCLHRDGDGRPLKFESKAESPDEYLIELERFDDSKAIERVAGAKAPANARIMAGLHEHTELEFVDTSLKDAIEFLGDLHQIKIEIDKTALKKAGIDPAVPVTFKVQSVTLYSALEMSLKPLKLRFELREGRLVITPARVEN